MLIISIDSGVLVWLVWVILCLKIVGRKWWLSNFVSIFILILWCDIFLNNLCSKVIICDIVFFICNKNFICRFLLFKFLVLCMV